MNQSLIQAIVNLEEDKVKEIVRELLNQETDPWIIMNASREAMRIIGKKFEVGDCFIPELVYAGEILNQVSLVVKPKLAQNRKQEIFGKVVIGTVQGDIHDIAKDIVVFMLDINGFEVHDLGVDVSPRDFVDKVIELDAEVLALSGFLTLAFEPMKATVEMLSSSGQMGKTRVMIGGGPVDQQVQVYTGAHAWGKDAMAAVQLARDWVGSE
ncbi:MAG: cobalamin-dependent protein [Anaerolineales bacterium]|nr:cobalamin-dependent protein [Anaerolineales bacterium]